MAGCEQRQGEGEGREKVSEGASNKRKLQEKVIAACQADAWQQLSWGSTDLGDALDVVPQDLAMALGAALSESLSSLAASRHCDRCSWL